MSIRTSFVIRNSCCVIFGSTSPGGFAMKACGFIKLDETMNWKKFFIAFIAAFVFLFVFGFIWYGMLMRGAHQEVPTLLRTEVEFKNYFPWLVLGHIVMAFFLTILCARFVPPAGAGASAGLGILVGLVYAGAHLISFAVQPLTTKILAGWILGSVIQFAIAGAIIGSIYKPAAAHVSFVKERHD